MLGEVRFFVPLGCSSLPRPVAGEPPEGTVTQEAVRNVWVVATVGPQATTVPPPVEREESVERP